MLDAEGVEMEGEEKREEGGFYGVESFPDPNGVAELATTD